MTELIDNALARIDALHRRDTREHCDLIARMERCALRAEDIVAHAHQALDAVCAPGDAPAAADLVEILRIAADIRDTLRRRP